MTDAPDDKTADAVSPDDATPDAAASTGTTPDDTTADDTTADDTTATDPTQADAAAEQAPRSGPRPSPGTPATATPRANPSASAASRARRIGGRPMPGPTGPTGQTVRPAGDRPAPAGPTRSEEKAELSGKAQRAEKAQRKAEAKIERKVVREIAKDTPAAVERPGLRSAFDAWWAVTVAAIIAVAMIVVVTIESHGVWWGDPIHKSSHGPSLDASTQVLAAAKTCAAAITGYDYRTFAASEQAGLKCTTGGFSAQYKAAMEQTIKSLASQSQTVQVTQIAKAGIRSISPDGTQWVILIYGQQQVTNKDTAAGTPRLDLLSIQVTMNKVGNAWLVSNLATVTS